MTRYFPFFFLLTLAGCVSMPSASVSVTSVVGDTKIYNLVATLPQGLADPEYAARPAIYDAAVASRATLICAPGGYDILSQDQYESLLVPFTMHKHFQIRCR